MTWIRPNPTPLKQSTHHVALACRKQRGLVTVFREAAIVKLLKKSERLWQAAFEECDLDGDQAITRRELNVLMKRLNLQIPSEDELSQLISEVDVDENGTLDYREFTDLLKKLGIERTADLVVATPC